MAVKANEFNDITTQLAHDTEKQLSDSENKQQEDIRAEEQRRRDEYEKARKEAERKSMGPLTALMHGDFERFGEALIEEDPLVNTPPLPNCAVSSSSVFSAMIAAIRAGS